jgi:hypothetical protein
MKRAVSLFVCFLSCYAFAGGGAADPGPGSGGKGSGGPDRYSARTRRYPTLKTGQYDHKNLSETTGPFDEKIFEQTDESLEESN